MELKALIEVLQAGGPSAIAIVMCVLWWMERKRGDQERERSNTMGNKLIELSTSQADAAAKISATLTNIQQMLFQLPRNGGRRTD